MPKNYYFILGVPSDSSLKDIKSAYRRLAKEFHPDYFGEARAPFLAIQEAYTVLSDPERRKKYDDSLNSIRIHAEPGRRPVLHPEAREDEVEPLIPEFRRAEPLGRRHSSALRSFGPEYGSLIERFFNTASECWDYGRSTGRNVEIEVTLSAKQALRGGQVRLSIPARIRCPECGGRGGFGSYECGRCFRGGYLQGRMPLMLDFPANLPHNHTVRFSLERFGLPHLSLTVRFRREDRA